MFKSDDDDDDGKQQGAKLGLIQAWAWILRGDELRCAGCFKGSKPDSGSGWRGRGLVRSDRAIGRLDRRVRRRNWRDFPF